VFVYGAHPDNDLPLTEASPLRPTPGLDLAAHQADAEAVLADRATDAGGPATTTVLRFAMVIGPGMDNVLTRLLEAPRITTVRGHRPPLQFLHLDDAARAIAHALDHRLGGTYNVSAEGWLSFDEVTAIATKRTVDVPEELAYSAAERLWRLGIGEHPPGIVDHLMLPWVMSPEAFIATGWQPQATNRDALASAVEEHAAFVSLAGARTQRRSLRRAAAASAGTVAGLLLLRGWRRRRRAERPDVPRA
jgi:nucleoside-diphosphate-sugar epimerase